MAYKQEPCPLCGRDMTAIETYPGRGELYCGYCDLTIGGNDAKTPEELIALMDSSEHRRLEAENAKLLELIEQMHRYMADTVEHNGYAIQTTGFTMLGSRVKECEEVMRKLGIKVN